MSGTDKRKDRNSARALVWSRWVLQTARKPSDLDLLERHTGVYLMERCHRQLTNFILENNQLIDQFEAMPLIGRQNKLMQELLNFVTEQFDREEWLIEQYELRNSTKQQEEHQQFIGTVERMIKDFEGGTLKIGLKLKLYLKNWMITHVAKLDYVTFNLVHWEKNIVHYAKRWEHVAMFIHNLGITQIDEDHKTILVSILDYNQKIQDHLEGHVQEWVGDFQLLLSRIAEHFNREEVLIRHFDFPLSKEHLAEHRHILCQLTDLRDRIETGKEEALTEVREQTLLIWINHINKVDAITFSPEGIAGRVSAQAKSWQEMAYFVRPTTHDWVDQSHKTVIQKILKLVPVIEQFNRDESRLDDSVQDTCYLLQKIIETVQATFEKENQWLEKNRPSHWERHLRSHAELLTNLQDYRHHLKMGVVVFSPKVKALTLRPWINHINEEDFEVFGNLDIGY